MSGRKKRRFRPAWPIFFVLLLLFPLLVTSATPGAVEMAAQSALYASTVTAAPIPPRQEKVSAAPQDAPVPAAPTASAAAVTPAPVKTPAPQPVSGDTFSDVFTDVAAPADLTAQSAPESTSAAPEMPVPSETPAQAAEPVPEETDPDHWEYTSDSIQVVIDRIAKDDFVYFAADLRLTDVSQFSYAFANEKFGSYTEALSDIAERHNPLLAINGDFCGFHDNGIIIRGGELFRKQNSARTLLIVEADGALTVMTDRTEKQGLVANRLMERGVRHTFEFGPVLVENGEPSRLRSAILRVDEGYLEPRTAIGQFADDPLHYLVIVVDGRREGYSAGCDLPALQQLFLDHGVQTAFNLDGGGSTTLWFDGEVINRPAAGEERKVSDIVMFMR